MQGKDPKGPWKDNLVTFFFFHNPSSFAHPKAGSPTHAPFFNNRMSSGLPAWFETLSLTGSNRNGTMYVHFAFLFPLPSPQNVLWRLFFCGCFPPSSPVFPAKQVLCGYPHRSTVYASPSKLWSAAFSSCLKQLQNLRTNIH